MHKHNKDNSDALAAFIAKKAEIDTLLDRIARLSADHFGTDHAQVNWGDVGTLGDYARNLRRITDAAFREGEHAE